MACGAKTAASELGVGISVQGPDTYDVTKQTAVLNAVAAKKPDAILSAPDDATAMYVPFKRAKDGGARIIFLDTNLARPGVGTAFIASDNIYAGQLAAKQLAKLVNGKGQVAVIRNTPGISSDDARMKGFLDTLKSYPGIKYVGAQISGGDPTKASSAVSALLAKYPNLAGIFDTQGLDTAGIGNAITRAKKAGVVKVVALDSTSDEVKLLRDNVVQVLITQTPYEMGYRGVKTAVAALKGQPVTAEVATPVVVVTKDNVDQPKIQKYLYKTTC
jgi:ribose transport system substrate-binding protein